MNNVLDDVLVGLVLAASVVYAVYALGPRAWRPRVLLGVASLVDRLPRFFGLQSVARRLETAAASKSGGACGGCDNCGSSKAPPPGQADRAGQAVTPAEISVPLSKIGKRAGGG